MRAYRIHLCLGVLGLVALVLIYQHQPKPDVIPGGHSARPSATSRPGNNLGMVAAETAVPPSQATAKSLRRLSTSRAPEPDETAGTDGLEQLTGTLTESELQGLLYELAVPHPDETDLELRQLLLDRWVELNPSAAVAYVGTWPEGPPRAEAMGQIAIAWGNSNLPEALQWVRGLADGESKISAILNLGYEAARFEPRTALELALQLPPDRARDELLTHAAGQWAVSDPVAAAQWAGQISDAPLRGRILSDFATVWAEDDPKAAATFVATTIPAGEFHDRAVTAIVQRWAQQSPTAAAQWVQQFPESPLRAAAVQNLVSVWANDDPVSVGEWLNGLPVGSVKDRAIAAYASVVAVSAPADGAAWTNAISDPVQRKQSHESRSRLWPDIR